jgi:hypothetical protein
VIDLRLICDADADFATPIEPSVEGGSKIATAIAAMLAEHDFAAFRATVFGKIGRVNKGSNATRHDWRHVR